MEYITTRYQKQIAGTLTCFDRIVLTGNLCGHCYSQGMMGYLYENKIRCFDFADKVAKPLADQLKSHTESIAETNGMLIEYLQGSGIRKESLVQEKLAKRGNHPGLICIFSCVEGCKRFVPWHDKKKKHTSLIMRNGQCLHYYFYFIDEVLGLCYLRIPTWLPCRLQFYFNGHNYLANRLAKEKIEFTMEDNCFTAIDSFDTANDLAAKLDPTVIEQRLRYYVKSLIPAIEQTFPDQYYWSIMQLELSTDITFKNDSILPELYNQLVSTAMHTVKVPDIASFLGFQMPRTKFDNCGSSLKKTWEGVRLKHNYGKHSIKMYDKFKRVLRVETTSNQVNLFHTHRLVFHRDGSKSMTNALVPKSLRSLPLLFEIMAAANRRYHEYISAIEDFSVGRQKLKKITAPVSENSRNYQGINFFNEADDELLLAVFSGAFNITGFRNRDIKRILNRKTTVISRALKRLRVHGLIKRIGQTYKYYLTALGREVIATGIKLRELYIIPQLNFTHS
jgi:hypothetical protein